MSLRTFLAVDIDAATRDRLAEVRRQVDTGGAKIRWVPPENLHVTLKFLGDVADDVLPELCRLTAEAAGEIQPFEFDVRGVQPVPPDGRRLRMLWANVQDPAGRMAQLHARVEEALQPLGIPRENRRFRPHLTLARVKYTRRPDELRHRLRELAERDFGVNAAEQVVAYTSQLTPQGSVYTPVARAPLGG